MAYRIIAALVTVFGMTGMSGSSRALELDEPTQAMLEQVWVEGSPWLFNGGPLSLTDGDVFPVVTRSMQARVLITDRALDYRPMTSLCVIGDDDLSAEWLATNRDYLLETSAICIVANVASQQRLIALQRNSAVPLWPMVADQLAQALNLSHYPVLIDARARRIRQ